MKTNQILTALNLVKNRNNTNFCANLANIYDHIKSISSEIISYEYIHVCIRDFKNFEFKIFTIETKTGSYKISVPIANDFYDAFFALLPGPKVETIDNSICDLLINLPIDCFNDFKKALLFAAKSDFRPQLTGVLIDMQNNELNIVATDAHKLYKSETYLTDHSEPLQILINANDLKNILASKNKFISIECYFKPETTEIDFCIANGVKFNPMEEKFPNYNAVLPEYETFMEFDKKEFVNKVSIAKLSANKTTKQVNFHLNGSIAISASDFDFNNGANLDMPYISKNFIDTDISFNGSFLLDCLKAFESKTVKLFTEGSATRGVLIGSNECKSTVLLMPVVNKI